MPYTECDCSIGQHQVLPAYRGTRRRLRQLQAPPVKGLTCNERSQRGGGRLHLNASHMHRTNGVEMLIPCSTQLDDELDITKDDIGF